MGVGDAGRCKGMRSVDGCAEVVRLDACLHWAPLSGWHDCQHMDYNLGGDGRDGQQDDGRRRSTESTEVIYLPRPLRGIDRQTDSQSVGRAARFSNQDRQSKQNKPQPHPGTLVGVLVLALLLDIHRFSHKHPTMFPAPRPAPKFSGRGRPLSPGSAAAAAAASGPGDRVWWLLAQAQDFQTQAVPANAAAQAKAQSPQTTRPAGKQN